MKCLLLLSVAACAESVLKDPDQGNQEGDRNFYFYGDGNDTMHLVDPEEAADIAFINEYIRNLAYNAYWLFTRDSPITSQIIGLSDVGSLENSNFDFAKVTAFLAHGWNGDGGNSMNRELTAGQEEVRECQPASAASVLRDPVLSYKESNRFIFLPKGDDGTPHLVDAEELVDFKFIEEYIRNPANNAYWLYTRLNPSSAQVLVLNNVKSVLNSNLDASRTTVFLAHGWGGSGGDKFNRMLIDAFLQVDDCNVIVLDWSKLASRSYTSAKASTAAVGTALGQFVNWLVSNFIFSYDRIHLVGFSLGGHLVGYAGRTAFGAVRRITALDPAGFLWSFDNNRLSKRDALYVEVIHTDNTLVGYAGRLGHADFYPNGGSNMPGCSPMYANMGCSHSRVVAYMASSVKYNHLLANECASMSESVNDRCRGTLYPMGNSDLHKARSGIFRVNTGETYPF